MSDNAGGGFDFRHDYKSGLALKHCSPCRALPLSLRSFRQEHIIVSGEVVMCQLKGLCSQHFQGILTPVCYCQFPCGSQEASDFNSLMVDSVSRVLPLIPESDT